VAETSNPPNWERFAEQIAYLHEEEVREGRYAETPEGLHPAVLARLAAAGFESLFSHQAEAISAWQRREDVLVTTGTSSGKSLAYVVPTLQLAHAEPMARALYLFPTKALAQDQLERLRSLAGTSLSAGVYDGDTPQSQRAAIRRTSQVVFTNPDMLHVGILPGHQNWARFLKSLRLIVIDEVHVYRGIFGSHVGNVLRRLLRQCEAYRSNPQIIACSATTGNPAEHFRLLTGREATIVNDDGSPRGRRTYILWSPPRRSDGTPLGTNATTSEIVVSLVQANQRTLAFSRTRVSAELVLKATRRRLEEVGIDPATMESYRAGYTVKERRNIEQSFFRGELRGLSATSAMELGVDVGGLDAVVMNGYPGSQASFWQQAGRAGRGSRAGLAIMVAAADPLEQFLLRNPDRLFGRTSERAVIQPDNPTILSEHLQCAAHERPLAPSELIHYSPGALAAAERLESAGYLRFFGGQFAYAGVDSPALNVNLRNGGGATIRLMTGAEELGSMEFQRALSSAHPGAVYLHRGQTFLVRELDLAANRANLEPTEVPYYTQPVMESSLTDRQTLDSRDGRRLVSCTVSDQVIGYRRKALDGEQVYDVVDLDLPVQTFDTYGVRCDFPALSLDEDMAAQIGGVHGAEHALMAVAPWFAGCDRGDLGSTWYAYGPETGRPGVAIYDRVPGGVGLAEAVYAAWPEIVRAALELATSCPCRDGCPACLLSPRCESGNEPIDKPLTVQNLQRLIDSL